MLPLHEVNAEKRLIKWFARLLGAKIIKLQTNNDDGEVDGILEYKGKMYYIEVRRKGFPNHSGKTTYTYSGGWENYSLRTGIFLNESTIRNHLDVGFIFIVEIKGCKPRIAVVDPNRVQELLKQPYKEIQSVNSGVMQSVKKVRLHWFAELKTINISKMIN